MGHVAAHAFEVEPPRLGAGLQVRRQPGVAAPDEKELGVGQMPQEPGVAVRPPVALDVARIDESRVSGTGPGGELALVQGREAA